MHKFVGVLDNPQSVSEFLAFVGHVLAEVDVAVENHLEERFAQTLLLFFKNGASLYFFGQAPVCRIFFFSFERS